MPLEFVNIHGQRVDLTGSGPSFQAAPKARKEGPKDYHRGWLTEGYPPGFVVEAQRLANSEVARWANLSSQDKAQAIKDGQRQPLPWDETRFISQTKRKRVRRPFEVPSSAEECKVLAERTGWTHVVVTELRKGGW